MASPCIAADLHRLHSLHKTPAVLKVFRVLGLLMLIYVCMDVCSGYRVEPEGRLFCLMGTVVTYHVLTALAWRKARSRGRRP